MGNFSGEQVKKHYSEKGGHRARREFSVAQRFRERHFPNLHFRLVPAPVAVQQEQSAWVRRIRRPNYP
jgi:hypothetical protein